jgi:hypothetical protein
MNTGGLCQPGKGVFILLIAVAASGFLFGALAADAPSSSAGSAAPAESAPVLPAPLTAPGPSGPPGKAAPAPAVPPGASGSSATSAAPASSSAAAPPPAAGPVLPSPMTAPYGASAPAAPPAPPTTGAATASPRPAVPRHARIEAEEVEPAQGRLQLNTDAWVLAAPTRGSRHVKRVHAPKYVLVTGLAADYVRVRLRDGTTGYVSSEAVNLVKPADKVFSVTHNSPVYEKPSQHSRRVAELHTPGDVQVIGIAPDYLNVRMRSGIEGFAPTTAFE